MALPPMPVSLVPHQGKTWKVPVAGEDGVGGGFGRHAEHGFWGSHAKTNRTYTPRVAKTPLFENGALFHSFARKQRFVLEKGALFHSLARKQRFIPRAFPHFTVHSKN
jgi:hypothetical protein